jgi:glycosyltransferase involved in cell wall biosynthesis
VQDKMKVVLVTNIPPPYRVPVFNYIQSLGEIEFTVIYCAERERNRSWDYGCINHNHIFLKENYNSHGDNYIHKNIDVLYHLKSLDPDIVITTGFNPTHLFAFCFTLLKRKKHIPMTDGTIASESFLTWKHRLARRVVYSLSHAYIGASEESKALYQMYGIKNSFFKSHLAIMNERFNKHENDIKKYDLLFSGRFVDGKCPLFIINVLKKLRSRLQRDISILFLGAGPLEDRMHFMLKDYPRSAYKFYGFASQDDLPALYGSARIFVFPTMNDTWGVVVNEACAAGLPVITTPAAGVAGELVKNDVNGYICDIDEELWCDRLSLLLSDIELCRKFGATSINIVSEYNYKNAAYGILDAVKHAAEKKR